MFQLLTRALRLKCPACGVGPLYRSMFSMNQSCESCKFSFEREDGFYLGAIYVNYGATALLVTILFPALVLTSTLPSKQALWVCFAFSVVFPIAIFRHARSLWLAADCFWDPKGPGGDAVDDPKG